MCFDFEMKYYRTNILKLDAQVKQNKNVRNY